MMATAIPFPARSGDPKRCRSRAERVDFDTAGQTATAIFQDSTEVAIYEGLYRSSDERCIAGVCGGLAHKWNISKTGLRVAAFFTMFFFGIIIPIYIVCWILFPSRPTENS
jgi:phage shock protein C